MESAFPVVRGYPDQFETVRRPLKDVPEVIATVIATTIKGHCRKSPEILYKWSGSSELPE